MSGSNAFIVRDTFLTKTLSDLHSKMHRTFIVDGIERFLWSSTIKTDNEKYEARKETTGETYNTSTHKLFMDILESDANRRWMVKHRAGVKVWVGWLAALVGLNKGSCLTRPYQPPEAVMSLEGKAACHKWGTMTYEYGKEWFLGTFWYCKDQRKERCMSPRGRIMTCFILWRQWKESRYTDREPVIHPPFIAFIFHWYTQHVDAKI